MTPTRLLALTTRALSRAPSRLELEVWGDALACRGQHECPLDECPLDDCPHDDEADAALKQHIATSTYPPTPADVRRIAISYANLRVETVERQQRDAGAEQAVPPTAEYLAARRAFDAKQAERQRELAAATRPPAPDPVDEDVAAGSPS